MPLIFTRGTMTCRPAIVSSYLSKARHPAWGTKKLSLTRSHGALTRHAAARLTRPPTWDIDPDSISPPPNPIYPEAIFSLPVGLRSSQLSGAGLV